MNVKSIIQTLQSTIDELSFHPADTKLKLQTDNLTQLADAFTVEKTGDVVTVTIKQAMPTPSTSATTPDPDPDDLYGYGLPYLYP